jgi:hypothetical protein
MTVVVAIPAMTMMMVVVTTNVDDNLSIRWLGERCGENEGEQGVQKDFHTCCDSHCVAQVVIRAQHLHQSVILTPPIKRLV